MPRAIKRCFWADGDDLMAAYHDEEWGVPLRDDRRWYEKLLLDGAQAGLSWLTILRKREGYRRAFADFDPAAVARFNARAFLELQAQHGSFDAWIWEFVGGQPVAGKARGRADMPARTPLSDQLSKELKGRGFTFVGSTIVY